MRFARLLILDSSIRTTLGHHYEYARSVVTAARRYGLATEVAVHRDVEPDVREALSARPAFRLGLYDHVIPGATGNAILKRLDGICWIFAFFRDWRTSGLSRTAASPDLLLFVPTAVEVTVFALLLWLRARPAARRPKTALLFRFDPRRTMKLVGRIARPLVADGTLMLTTDSDVLAQEFRAVTGLTFTVLPIPHVADLRRPARPSGGTLRLLFPGGARDEKGMDVLAGALTLLENFLAERSLHVTVQCNIHHHEELTARAMHTLEDLERRFPESLRLVKSSLTTDAYYDMLADAQAVLLPYRRDDYRARTSGVFAEALAAGKPVIVTSGTWMAAQLARHGAGISLEQHTARDLAAAITALGSDYPSFAARADAAVGPWIALHNDEHLLRLLLSHFGSGA